MPGELVRQELAAQNLTGEQTFLSSLQALDPKQLGEGQKLLP